MFRVLALPLVKNMIHPTCLRTQSNHVPGQIIIPAVLLLLYHAAFAYTSVKFYTKNSVECELLSALTLRRKEQKRTPERVVL